MSTWHERHISETVVGTVMLNKKLYTGGLGSISTGGHKGGEHAGVLVIKQNKTG